MPTLILPTPTEKQRMLMTDRHKYVGFGGARGGGKSFGVDIMVCANALRYPGITQTIVRKTYPELRENHILKLRDMLHCYDHSIATYNDSNKEIRCVNGSRIVFKYCDSPDHDLPRFQGLQTDILYLDECTQHTEEVWNKLKAIVRGSNNYKKQIILTCNPGGPGMGWFKKLFIDRNFGEGEDPEDYSFIQSLVTDNVPLMKAQPDYVKQLESLPPKLKKAWLEGDWNILEGQFFEEFRITPDVIAANTAGFMLDADELLRQRRFTHVIEPIDLSRGEPRTWKIYRSYDYGYGKPFSCGWWAVDYDGIIYRIMEYYGCTSTPNEGVRLSADQQFAEIARIEHEHPWLKGKTITGVADPAIFAADGGPSVNEFALQHGIIFRPGDHQRIPGWMQVHYRMQFDEQGFPRMYIFKNCKDFIRTIPLMMYDEHKPEDLDTDLEDHISDEVRYFCMSRPIKPLKPVTKQIKYSDPLNQFKRGN